MNGNCTEGVWRGPITLARKASRPTAVLFEAEVMLCSVPYPTPVLPAALAFAVWALVLV